MSGIPGTNIIAPVVPLDTTDVHPSHLALYGKGGYRTVASTAERDAIPSARREEGMLVYVTADSKTYQLGSNLTTWTEYTTGGGGGGGNAPFITVGRSGADFVCTGTLGSPTDHTTIQSAIDSIASTGGTVFIKEGTYFLGGTINITAANIAVVGTGRATELRCVGDYGNVFLCALASVPTKFPGLSGLRFENLRFETTVERTTGACIRANYTHNAIFRNLWIADCTYGHSFGLVTPVPAAFFNGIYLDAQSQCLVDKVTAMCVSRGIHLNGSGYANADFSYDGLVSNCSLWGKPGGTRYGTAIYLGANCGGVVLDFNSTNQWEYALYADATSTTQGGGIITIRGGYAENDTHGYHVIGYENVVVHDLWGSLHVIECEHTTVVGVALPSASVEVTSNDDGGEYFLTVYGSASITTTGDFPSTISIATGILEGDSRLTDARTPTGSAGGVLAGTYPNPTLASTALASPPVIGGTTPAAGTFTTLVATSRANLPSGASGTPAARDIYAVADTLRYRDSTNTERLILNATDNLANLSNTATARTNLGLGTLATQSSVPTHASSHQTGGADAVANVVVSPSQITSNQNDYSPGTGDIVRLSSDAARDITGITAGSAGQVRVLTNVGSFAITLKHQSASSTAANRFLVPWAGDCIISADSSVMIVYDSTTARWRVT